MEDPFPDIPGAWKVVGDALKHGKNEVLYNGFMFTRLGSKRIGGERYSMVSVERADSASNTRHRLTAAMDALIEATRKHNVHPEVTEAATSIIRMLLDVRDEYEASLRSAYALLAETPRLVLSYEASRKAKRLHASSPQGIAKPKAFELWRERHAGKHPQLRTNEQFATECMRRWPALTSAKVILAWCTEWNKQAKRESHPAS